MFDTMVVGKRIAELRKRNNLTQPELADAMGVSFQAVSNWERGNSMPDISKLSDLAGILGTTVDDLLGKKNPVVEKLAKNEEPDFGNVSREELTEAAEIAKPHVVEKMAEKVDGKDVVLLLPFLGEEYIAKLADEAYSEGRDISVFLPFLAETDADALFSRAIADGRENIAKFLPFASDKKLIEAAVAYKKAGKNVVLFLPFLDDKTVRTLASDALKSGGLTAALPYLPFLDDGDAESITEYILHKKADNE